MEFEIGSDDTENIEHFEVLAHNFEADGNDITEHDVKPSTSITGFIWGASYTEADSTDIAKHPPDDKPRPFVCAVCDKHFTRNHSLKRHMSTAHAETFASKNVYPCSQCDKRFTYWSASYAHRNVRSVCKQSHSAKKPSVKCYVCNKRFAQKEALVRHSRIHSGKKPYKCHLCDKAFNVSHNLKSHIRVHTGEKPYKCSVCDKRFSHGSHMHAHNRRIHSNVRPYICSNCGKLFKTNIELKRHGHIHTGAKPYSCAHCPERFQRPGPLKVHLLKSHSEGTWLTCHICQKKFSKRCSLRYHMCLHEKPYVCSECPKCFGTAKDLKKHHSVHRGRDYKPFGCSLCSKSFRRLYAAVCHFEMCVDGK